MTCLKKITRSTRLNAFSQTWSIKAGLKGTFYMRKLCVCQRKILFQTQETSQEIKINYAHLLFPSLWAICQFVFWDRLLNLPLQSNFVIWASVKYLQVPLLTQEAFSLQLWFPSFSLGCLCFLRFSLLDLEPLPFMLRFSRLPFSFHAKWES